MEPRIRYLLSAACREGAEFAAAGSRRGPVVEMEGQQVHSGPPPQAGHHRLVGRHRMGFPPVTAIVAPEM